MAVEMIFLVVTLLMIVFLFSGMFIHSILLLTGIIGIILLESPQYMTGFLQSDPFIRTASYTLTTVPLFIIMAQFISRSGIVEDMYTFVYNLSKGRKSILGFLTVLAGGLMGAVSGSSNASAAAMAQVAVPQLMKRGYNDGIAGTTVAAAGSLSSVIPPSIILILWGVATETPIGLLFMGALIPGIIIMLIICLVMYAFLKFSERKSQMKEVTTFKAEPLPISKVIIAIGLIGLIVIIVFYGIFKGIFTPTEAAAIGALVAFIAALILRKVNKSFIIESCIETVNITAMILMIMIGAQIFGRFVSLSLLPRKVIGLLGNLLDYPVLILIILCVIYFIIFMFVEGAAVILMTAPIVLPLITEIGVDKIWFGVLVGILCTLGLMTPPVGLSVFSVAGATGIASERIFKYTLPLSMIITVVVFALLVIFPGLATWLPSLM